ncbi:hypothetical protein ABZT49_00980 [Methylobacterium sp. EM32]|uniref:hypothetical protein n=1 Tax=Methylobacterium sp. EM32 TaxID=3163481 RepID=UPI0033A45DEC
MPGAWNAAAALHRIAVEESGEGLSRARTGGLLYYAQGISLATTGEPLFEATFRPTGYGFEIREFDERSGPWWHIPDSIEPGALAGSRILREVLQVFGPLNAQALAGAIRSEAPWRTVGGERRERALVSQTEIHDHFAEMLDDGRDIIDELGLPTYPDRPSWEQAYRVAVNVKCLAGHPLFNETESRTLRRKLDLEDLPDDWDHDAPDHGRDEGLPAFAAR